MAAASAVDPNTPLLAVREAGKQFDMSEQEHIERIVDRLRRDHPDPAMRQQLYDEGGLLAYVETLLNGADADAQRVADAVRAAEDGSVGPMR